jgi:hypothetical protein
VCDEDGRREDRERLEGVLLGRLRACTRALELSLLQARVLVVDRSELLVPKVVAHEAEHEGNHARNEEAPEGSRHFGTSFRPLYLVRRRP